MLHKIYDLASGELMRYVFHIDVNSAFLSWSAVYRIRELGEKEDLRNVPSIIGGDEESRHGIVLAKSQPAKKYGIETAEPVATARRKCPGLVVVPSDYQVYKRYSRDFIAILKKYSGEIYQYSIDEAWVVFDGCEELYGDIVEFAYRLKDEIKETLGFTVNIGVSTRFDLAKIAGDFEKPDKVHTLFEEEIPTKLWPLPVGVILYVGKKMAAALRNLGIVTVKDLYDADPEIISRNLGKFGTSLWENVHGKDIDPAGYHDGDQKGYGHSTTTAVNTTEWKTAKEILMKLADQVGARLRADKVYASCVSVSARYDDFDHTGKQMMIDNPTNSTSVIYEASCELLASFWNEDRPIRQLGIRTTKISDEKYEQLSFFDMISDASAGEEGQTEQVLVTRARTDSEKMARADAAMDALRLKMGKDIVKRGNQLK